MIPSTTYEDITSEGCYLANITINGFDESPIVITGH